MKEGDVVLVDGMIGQVILKNHKYDTTETKIVEEVYLVEFQDVDGGFSAYVPSWNIKQFTCNTCQYKDSCRFAFDQYNINGDCLAKK